MHPKVAHDRALLANATCCEDFKDKLARRLVHEKAQDWYKKCSSVKYKGVVDEEKSKRLIHYSRPNHMPSSHFLLFALPDVSVLWVCPANQMQTNKERNQSRIVVIVFAKALPCKHFDDTITSCRDDETAVLAPDHATDAFAAHDAMCCDLLGANALIEGPKSNRSIMASRYCFSTIFTQ